MVLKIIKSCYKIIANQNCCTGAFINISNQFASFIYIFTEKNIL